MPAQLTRAIACGSFGIDVGAPQLTPLNVTDWLPLAATQNDVDTHDTNAVAGWLASSGAEPDQVVPLKTAAVPAPTPTQKAAVLQDSAVNVGAPMAAPHAPFAYR